MRNDLYVKIMLTVIAMLLAFIAFRPMLLPSEPTGVVGGGTLTTGKFQSTGGTSGTLPPNTGGSGKTPKPPSGAGTSGPAK